MVISQSTLGLLLYLDEIPTVRERREAVASAADFISREISLAPAHVRAGIMGLCCVFAVWVAVAGFCTGSRAGAIRSWERFSGTPGRMLIRLLRSLGNLWILELGSVQRQMGIASPVERRAARHAYRRDALRGGR